MTHDEIRESLAVYALDAVDADEADIIDLHLRECPRCRAEVQAHRETAGALATGHDTAPDAVWEGIAATLEPPAALELRRIGPRPAPSSLRSAARLPMVAAGIAAAMVAFLGIQNVQQDRQIDRMESALSQRTILAAAVAAQTDPSARSAELRSPAGIVLARAVVDRNGTGFLWSEGLPATAKNRTYQLWAVIDGQRISAGVLGDRPTLSPFRIAGNVSAFALTEETSGGVIATKNAPVAVGGLAPVQDA